MAMSNVRIGPEDKIMHVQNRIIKCKRKPLQERFSPLLLRDVLLEVEGPTKPTGMGIRLEASTPPPKTMQMEEAVCGMMLENELFRSRMASKLALLKKIRSVGKDVFALDGIRTILRGFDHMRALIIDEKEVTATFNSISDLAKVTEFAEDLGFAVQKSSDRRGREILTLRRPVTESELSIGPFFCSFRHEMFGTRKPDFDDSLTRFVEYACLLPYRVDWTVGASMIHLNEYQPIMEIMFGSGLYSGAGDAVLGFYSKFRTGTDGEKAAVMRESGKSQIERRAGKRAQDDVTMALKKEYLPAHVSAMSAREKTNNLFVCIDCDFDFERIERMLESQGYAIEEEAVKSRRDYYVNKATQMESRSFFKIQQSRTVKNEKDEVVMRFVGENSVFIDLTDRAVTEAAEILEIIIGKLLLRSPMYRDADHGSSGLSNVEREVVAAADGLMRMYNFFLAPGDEREALAKRLAGEPVEDPKAIKWVIETMREAEGDYVSKSLHVLRVLHRRVSRLDFSIFGSEQETQDHAKKLLSQLKTRIADFETMKRRY